MSQPLHGIIPPMVTPLRDRDALDEAGVERLVEHMIAGGVSGIFILGTSGEGPNLSYRIRKELIQRVCWQASSRLPVLVGITDTSLLQAVTVARLAAEAGAFAVVSSAPYYFAPDQQELATYVEHLLPKLPLPLFLYNMPQMTRTVFALETVRRLMDHERIIGIKDSSGDLLYFSELLKVTQDRRNWTTLVGPDHQLVDTVRMGGSGGVNGGANVMPRLYADLYHAAKANDEARCAELNSKASILQRIYKAGGHNASVTQGLKCALSLLHICSDLMTEPFDCLRGKERDMVREVLQDLGLC